MCIRDRARPGSVAATSTKTKALPSPIDEEVIQGILAINPEAGASVLKKVIASFKEQLPTHLSNIRECIDRNEAEILRQRVHALKSMSGNVGASKLTKALGDVETGAATGRFILSEEEFDDIEELARHAAAALERWQ